MAILNLPQLTRLTIIPSDTLSLVLCAYHISFRLPTLSLFLFWPGFLLIFSLQIPSDFSMFYSDNPLKLTNQFNTLNRILANKVSIWMTGTNERHSGSSGMANTEGSLVLQHL